MVSLAEQRRGAEHLEAEHGVSERRACQVIGLWRSSKRRPSGRIEEAKLVRRVHELTERYPRYGYRKIHAILRSEGTAIGRERLRLIRKRGWAEASILDRDRRIHSRGNLDRVRSTP
jgi:putative transposase